ncbi:MAG: hypothetical protein JNN08_23795 [Bryobacterales bacterium]|nr:hypothetical protein [Bryobacterales bacterium]
METQILLKRDLLVGGYQDLKSYRLRRIEKGAVLQTSQPGEGGGLAVVPFEQQPKALINALIQQQPH